MWHIDDEAFETKDEAFEYFLDDLDFTDSSTLDELCEKMGYTKEQLLGTLLSLSLRNESLPYLCDRVLDAIEEVFQEEVEEVEETDDIEDEEDEEEEDGD